MTRKGIHHPIQAAIEDVYAAGHTPRLQIDARRNDVEVPDSVRRSWQARLVIDLDPSYPLDLSYDAEGVAVDLAFSGVVSRCRFAWRAIYAVIDRSTGRGIVVEAHLPPPELAAELTWIERQKKPRLSAVPLRPSAGSEGRPSPEGVRAVVPLAERMPSVVRDEPAPVAGGTPNTPPVGARSEPQPSPSVAPGSSSASDEAARERRARFRVIDGGR